METWMVQGGVGLLIAIIAWFIKRELTFIRADISGLGTRMNSYNTRLAHIEGKLGVPGIIRMDEGSSDQ